MRSLSPKTEAASALFRFKSKLKPEDWTLATTWFQENPSCNKYRKKDSGLVCSFVKLNGKIYALHGMLDNDAGFSKVKWALDQDNKLCVYKVSNVPGKFQMWPQALAKEAEIEAELGLILAAGRRSDSIKYMRIMPYFGPNLLTLANFEIEKHSLQELQVVLWFLGVSEALLALHQGRSSARAKGYVHLDLKADNIVVDENALVRLIDATHITGMQDGVVERIPQISAPSSAGFPAHIAPEIQQQQSVSVATDVYAFGELIREFLPYGLFYPGTRSALEVLYTSMKQEAPAARPALLTVQAKLLLIVLAHYNHMWEDDPNLNLVYQSMALISSCLKNCLAAPSSLSIDDAKSVTKSLQKFKANAELWSGLSEGFKADAEAYLRSRPSV